MKPTFETTDLSNYGTQITINLVSNRRRDENVQDTFLKIFLTEIRCNFYLIHLFYEHFEKDFGVTNEFKEIKDLWFSNCQQNREQYEKKFLTLLSEGVSRNLF